MWTEAQNTELEVLMRTASKTYVRKKATAVWNYGRGQSQGEIARFLNVGIRRTVGSMTTGGREQALLTSNQDVAGPLMWMRQKSLGT